MDGAAQGAGGSPGGGDALSGERLDHGNCCELGRAPRTVPHPEPLSMSLQGKVKHPSQGWLIADGISYISGANS